MKNYLKDERGKSSNLYPLYQTLINISTIDIQIFRFSVWHETSTGISNIRK